MPNYDLVMTSINDIKPIDANQKKIKKDMVKFYASRKADIKLLPKEDIEKYSFHNEMLRRECGEMWNFDKFPMNIK